MKTYIEFTNVTMHYPARSTEIWEITSTQDGTYLGQIKWFGRWRQYAFFPKNETIWNPNCLAAINDHIKALMRARTSPQEPLKWHSGETEAEKIARRRSQGREDDGSYGY